MSIFSKFPLTSGAVAGLAVLYATHREGGPPPINALLYREGGPPPINALLYRAQTTLLVAVRGTPLAQRHVRNLTHNLLIQSTFRFFTPTELGELSVTVRLSLGVRLTD